MWGGSKLIGSGGWGSVRAVGEGVGVWVGEPFLEATTPTIRDLRIHVAPTPTIRDLDLPGPSQEPPSGRLGLHFGIHLGNLFGSMLDTILEAFFGANPIW